MLMTFVCAQMVEAITNKKMQTYDKKGGIKRHDIHFSLHGDSTIVVKHDGVKHDKHTKKLKEETVDSVTFIE